MVQTTDEQKRTYPLPSYNYRVDIDGLTVGCSSVSGLTVERSTAIYRHGLSFREGHDVVQFRYEKPGTITLERGIVTGLRQLDAWLAAGDPRAMDVSLCDEEGSPLVTWHVARAVPIRLTAPSVTAESNEVAIERLEVEAHSITVDHPGAG